MASLAELYSATSGSLPLDFGQSYTDAGDASAEAGLQTSHLQHLYGTRALPAVVNRYASRGTFYSGGARQAADRLREDVGWETGTIQRQLSRTLSGLARNRVLGAAGVSV